jgi:hypothetical protein
MMNIIAFLLAIGCALASRNPVVLSPNNGTVAAGDTVVIRWANATTGFVNIDVESTFSEVLRSPLIIALGVPATQKSFSWKVPDILRTAVGYQVRVWGSAPPKAGDKFGVSPMFTVFNNIPKAINAFKVLSPNGEQPCEVGKPCEIKWDFPDTINGPAYVHIRLFKAGHQSPLADIAEVPAAQKSYTWQVPENAPYMHEKGLYVSVSGAGTPPSGPGFSNEMGGNGQAFGFASPDAAGQPGAQGNNSNNSNEFNEQAVQDIDTVTVTATTGTTTVRTTVTENNAAAAFSAAGSSIQAVWFLLVPLLVLLF